MQGSMMGYKLTEQAKEDLIEIWNYSADMWGEVQADRYLRKLESGFERIARGELVSKRPLPTFENVRSVRCEHHYVFFLSSSPPIILAVLHEKMDFISRLKNRLSDD